jgi:hypothetical protein
MNKALLIMGIITIGLMIYAIETAQIPPANVDYQEVYYINNQSSVYVEKDGWGLFEMNVKPRVKGFELSLKFPENTSYLVDIGGKEYKGTGTFKTTVSKSETLYIHFKVSDELRNDIYYKGATPQIEIHLEKAPFWRDHYTIHLIPRKSK